jgi:magnesium transporter
MIRTLAVTVDKKLKRDLEYEELINEDISWFWVDFDKPDEKEIGLLSKDFYFHPLSIEDCLQRLQRPKFDHYEGYNFFVLNSLNQKSFEPEEVGVFVGANYIVSVHTNSMSEIEESWNKAVSNSTVWEKGPTYILYLMLDKIVDQFFPAAEGIEDHLDELDSNSKGKSINRMMDEVFEIRGQLLLLRRIVISMRDLLYRILNSERLSGFKEYKLYLSDIYDHLLKLCDMIESSRDMTTDMRDSYMSMNSSRMNKNMMILTVISTIFMPLTFIAGVYGMNFDFMPELGWEYGYFVILGVMLIIGVLMVFWFKRKGWFDE